MHARVCACVEGERRGERGKGEESNTGEIILIKNTVQRGSQR